MQTNQLYMNRSNLDGGGIRIFTSLDKKRIVYGSSDLFRILEVNENSVKIEHEARDEMRYCYNEIFTVAKNTCQEMINCSKLQKE